MIRSHDSLWSWLIVAGVAAWLIFGVLPDLWAQWGAWWRGA